MIPESPDGVDTPPVEEPFNQARAYTLKPALKERDPCRAGGTGGTRRRITWTFPMSWSVQKKGEPLTLVSEKTRGF